MRIGTAGWSYPDWEGRVYPRNRPRSFHPLRYLSRFVDCIEVNSSFYAQPRSEHTARWCDLVQERPDFRFIFKLHQSFTHEPVPADPGLWAQAAEIFLQGIAPVRRRGLLSGVLLQFPATFRMGTGQVRRLGRLRSLLDGVPLILEVRHASWFTPPAMDTLRGLQYSVAHIDLPAAWDHPPPAHPNTGPIGYLRLHGRNAREWFRKGAGRDARYDYLYNQNEIRDLSNRAQRIAQSSADTYVITNNHFSGKALANALDLSATLRGTPPLAPAELVDAFPHLRHIARVEGQGNLFG